MLWAKMAGKEPRGDAGCSPCWTASSRAVLAALGLQAGTQELTR